MRGYHGRACTSSDREHGGCSDHTFCRGFPGLLSVGVFSLVFLGSSCSCLGLSLLPRPPGSGVDLTTFVLVILVLGTCGLFLSAERYRASESGYPLRTVDLSICCRFFAIGDVLLCGLLCVLSTPTEVCTSHPRSREYSPMCTAVPHGFSGYPLSLHRIM